MAHDFRKEGYRESRLLGSVRELELLPNHSLSYTYGAPPNFQSPRFCPVVPYEDSNMSAHSDAYRRRRFGCTKRDPKNVGYPIWLIGSFKPTHIQTLGSRYDPASYTPGFLVPLQV